MGTIDFAYNYAERAYHAEIEQRLKARTATEGEIREAAKWGAKPKHPIIIDAEFTDATDDVKRLTKRVEE